MFERCHFLLGEGNSIVIVVPENLPRGEPLTVSVSPEDIQFRSGFEEIADITCDNEEVFRRLARFPQVGLVEYDGEGDFPTYITNTAYVEVRRVGDM